MEDSNATLIAIRSCNLLRLIRPPVEGFLRKKKEILRELDSERERKEKKRVIRVMDGEKTRIATRSCNLLRLIRPI